MPNQLIVNDTFDNSNCHFTNPPYCAFFFVWIARTTDTIRVFPIVLKQNPNRKLNFRVQVINSKYHCFVSVYFLIVYFLIAL